MNPYVATHKVATIKKKHITLNNEFKYHRGRATTLEMCFFLFFFGMVGYMEIVAHRH